MTNQKISLEDMYIKFNQYALKREGEIKLMDGVLRKGKSFNVESDSIRFIDKLRSQEMIVPISNVEFVSLINSEQGKLQGATIGALTGFLAGYMFVQLTHERPNKYREYSDMSTLTSIALGGIVSGIGTIIGMSVGESNGCKEIFIFNKNNQKN
jgi:hypothetical protein